MAQALFRKDEPVTRLLIEFEAEPSLVRLSQLFKTELNKYKVNNSLWVGFVDDDPTVAAFKAKAAEDPNNVQGGIAPTGRKGPLLREDSLTRASKNPAGVAAAAGFAHFGEIAKPAQILSEQVDGYKMHFQTRMRQEVLSNVDALSPSWTDLMMWAVCCYRYCQYLPRPLPALISHRYSGTHTHL